MSSLPIYSGGDSTLLPLIHQHSRRRSSKVIATAYPQFTTMAIPIMEYNPPSPESETLGLKHANSKQPSKKKPSRALLYLLNRTRGTVGNASVLVVGALLIALSTHRVVSLIMTHRRWINAPITYMQRTCPAFDYEKLPEGEGAGKICITTLTDHKSPSRFQTSLTARIILIPVGLQRGARSRRSSICSRRNTAIGSCGPTRTRSL
jgi:hypothetical protein